MIHAKYIFASLLCAGLLLNATGCSHDSDDDGVNTPKKDNRHPTSDGERLGPTPAPDPGVTVKGRSLQLVKKPNSNDLAFGVVYSLASDRDGMTWLITFKTDITDAELKQLPDTMYWNVHYQLGAKPRINAVDAMNFTIEKNQIRQGQIKITGPKYILAEILMMQKDGFLMFGTNPSETLTSPKFVLDLGALCKSAPEYFSNITNRKRCHEIKLEDVGL